MIVCLSESHLLLIFHQIYMECVDEEEREKDKGKESWGGDCKVTMCSN